MNVFGKSQFNTKFANNLMRPARRVLSYGFNGANKADSSGTQDVKVEVGSESEKSGIVDCAVYVNGQRVNVESPEAALERVNQEDGAFMWLGMYHPSADELNKIAETFSLHSLAIEDAIHAHQRPKAEQYEDDLFVVFKTARYVESQEVIQTGEIMCFVGEKFVISVRHGRANPLADVRHQLESNPAQMSGGSGAVLWAIADKVVDDINLAIDVVTKDVDQIETSVFNPTKDSPSERIYLLKRDVLDLRRSMEPLGTALETLYSDEYPMVNPGVRTYFRDVHDHAIRGANRLHELDELLRDALQAHIAQVGLRQNEDMRRITAWAAILAVVTSIAGIYGMNFENMPELKWNIGYYLALGVMASVSGCLYVIFKKKRWL